MNWGASGYSVEWVINVLILRFCRIITGIFFTVPEYSFAVRKKDEEGLKKRRKMNKKKKRKKERK